MQTIETPAAQTRQQRSKKVSITALAIEGDWTAKSLSAHAMIMIIAPSLAIGLDRKGR